MASRLEFSQFSRSPENNRSDLGSNPLLKRQIKPELWQGKKARTRRSAYVSGSVGCLFSEVSLFLWSFSWLHRITRAPIRFLPSRSDGLTKTILEKAEKTRSYKTTPRSHYLDGQSQAIDSWISQQIGLKWEEQSSLLRIESKSRALMALLGNPELLCRELSPL